MSIRGLACVFCLAASLLPRAPVPSAVPASREPTGPAISQSFLAALPREKSEVAVYEIAIEGDPRPLRASSVLSMVPYDPDRHLEAAAGDPAAVASLKWRFFHRLFEGPKSYQLEASEFFYLDLDGLRPIKHSRAWTSWEGGGCCALRLRQADGGLRDPGGKAPPLPARAGLFPASEVPLLVRALDFGGGDRQVFEVALADGGRCGVQATLAGREEVRLAGDDTQQAERIVVHYDQPDGTWMDRLIFATRGREETYWRSVEPSRRLLRLDTEYYHWKLSMRWLDGAEVDYRRQPLPERLSRHLEAGA